MKLWELFDVCDTFNPEVKILDQYDNLVLEKQYQTLHKSHLFAYNTVRHIYKLSCNEIVVSVVGVYSKENELPFE